MATHYVNELDSEDDQNVFHDSENEASDEYDNVEDGIAVDRQPFRIYTNYVGDADSDYIESDDDLESIYSTDEEGKKEQPKFKQFDGVMEMNNPKFCKGQLFPDFKTFKEAVKNYSIVNMQPIKFKHSDSIRVQVVCRPPCKFNIWAAKSNDGNAIQIRSCELKHEGCILRFENKFGDYHYIAKKYQHRFQVDPKLSISSIRQMGLFNALTAVVPYAEHRCCARHLWTNLQRALGGNQKTKDLFWNAARSTYQAEFKRWMEELKKCNLEAYNWLADKPLSQWTRCEFQTFCLSDLLLNNHCESWNKCILEARCKTIISMLETIRCQLMEIFWKKKKFAEDNFAGKLCPRIQKKLDAAKIKSMSCQAIPNGAMSFEVRFDDKQMVVDLNKHTCT
ncbi:hypothetical protein LINPERHAP2_LOCUS1566 [Linum perenne]